ncbi:MAG: HEPN domain-containing protein [Clostridiales bacterium]|jgi:HEPN domain-containing protein|nr:HEPN domain-containing protein [Clostridiales bacterium]
MDNKVDYWLELCDEDLITAKGLFDLKRFLHMGFFCHLIAEKALKAAIAHEGGFPPKIHDLKKLSKLSSVAADLSEEQLDLLEQLNPLNIEARYPKYKMEIAETLSLSKCKEILSKTEAFLCWIKERLGMSCKIIPKK